MKHVTTDCLFCRIAKGDIPAALVADTVDAIAFRDINPQAPLHVLVIPRVHIDSLATASDSALLGSLMSLAAQIAKEQGYGESGFRTVINTGPDGGQSVGHLHVHVLAGRHLDWPPG
jgi:histidine triad (HIT) family protein